MKKFYLLLSFFLISYFSIAQTVPFTTTWKVDNGTGLDITIPTEGTGYNYTVDFGDGTVLNNQTGDVTHSYSDIGVYTVSISGDFPRIYFDDPNLDYTIPDKIKTIEQWGDIEWASMKSAFKSCSFLEINATDTPNLSQVTNMSEMFRSCESLNTDINNWDVSNVSDMSYLFYSAESFNQPLNNWDVSNVTIMSGMFINAEDFNQPLNNWDVSNVTNMNKMFSSTEDFNQPLNSWNVSNVTDMSHMFSFAHNFDKNLNNWDVSAVTDMSYMFNSAEDFNQPLNSWNVSNVTNMTHMFMFAHNFNQPLNSWDTSAVLDMSNMFVAAWYFNQPLNNWDVSNVINMDMMFQGTFFNQPLDNWDVSAVTSLDSMFTGCTSFNQDISTYNWEWGNISPSSFEQLIKNSGLNVVNYELFLEKLSMEYNNSILAIDASGLEYCDGFLHNYLTNTLGWTISGDSLSQDCKKIYGNISFDIDDNNCASNASLVNGINLAVNDGMNDAITYSSDGYYEMGVTEENYTVSISSLPSYLIASPASANVTFTTADQEIEQNFCISANQIVEDLVIQLIPINQARSGFEADYQLVVQNMGTETIPTGTINLTFDDSMQSFVSAAPAPTATTADELTFTVNNLPPFGQEVIDLTMQTFQPPTVNGDDILVFEADITPNSNDFNPEDNYYYYEQTVVNSYDPNDKQVLQGETVHIDDADQYLHYLIRFQNTGTASAINVRIKDTLHPGLDYSTFQPINASDDYRVEITNENKVEFLFDDINLPHESADEPGSHGFVAYKIKPKQNTAVGDVVSGDAQIYFDFNAPIITNMVSTEFVEDMSVENVTLAERSIKIYPNPTQNLVNLQTTNNIEVEEATIYNLQGKQLMNFSKNLKQLNIEELSTGMYLLQLKTNQGTVNRQLIKQ